MRRSLCIYVQGSTAQHTTPHTWCPVSHATAFASTTSQALNVYLIDISRSARRRRPERARQALKARRYNCHTQRHTASAHLYMLPCTLRRPAAAPSASLSVVVSYTHVPPGLGPCSYATTCACTRHTTHTTRSDDATVWWRARTTVCARRCTRATASFSLSPDAPLAGAP